jgi:threonine aldolase
MPPFDPMLDLRSDTVTRPSDAMRDAMAAAEVGDDVLDGDPTTRALEARVAERLGKDAALFFPSGSMANLAAICVHTRPGTELLVDADAHIVHWEMGGAAALAGAQVRPVRGETPVMTAHDLAKAARPRGRYEVEAGLVCLENTHNGAGGVVTPLAELRALAEVAQSLGLPVHLDGARLWNAHVATGTPLADFAACADSVMVSFSKGLGAPVGAALVGSHEVIRRADAVRKRLGGGLRQSGVIAAGALHGLEHHMAGLASDHANARLLADALDSAGGARVVAPDTNIVMLDLPKACAAAVVSEARTAGVRVSAWSPTRIRAVTHRDASRAQVAAAAPRLAEIVARVVHTAG